MMIRRYVQNMLRLAALTLMVTLTAASAHADAHSYASERRQIRACVLVSSAANGIGGTPENVTPHVFYILDRRSDLKPAGWEFVNPLASATISGDVYTRWQTRGGVNDPAFQNTPASVAFRPGQPLSKNFGAYWEVNLDTVSTDDLQQFDIVLMDYHNNSTQFSPAEREKLRHYVDSGGTIWLEDEGGFNIQSGGNYGGGQFIVDLGFAVSVPNNAVPTAATTHHPLLNFPYGIGQTDLASLGAAGIQYDVSGAGHHVHQGVNSGYNGVAGLANPRVLVPVVWAGTASGQLPYVSAGDYGAGHIVVSSGGIASGINNYVGGVDVGEGGNSATISGETMLGARPTDLKFAYNLVSWTSSVPTASVNARRTSGSQENVGAQLGTRFATVPPAAISSFGSGAVMHKGVIFVVDGNNVLHAYDASPQQDLDGDGNSDDGIRDYIYGSAYDEIWNVNLVGKLGTAAATRISTPTIVTVVNPSTGTPQDLVVVSTSLGATMAFNAFPTAGGVLATTSPMIWGITSGESADLASTLTSLGQTLPSPSPAFSDGIIFTLWNQAGGDSLHPWHVAAIDPFSGNEVFQNTGNIGNSVAPTTNVGLTGGIVNGIPNPVGSLSVGYVRDASTGALDKMIYVPSITFQSTDVGAAQIQGVWFSTKGEPLDPIDTNGNYAPRGARASVPWYLNPPNGNGIDLRPVVYKTNAAGVTTRLTYLTDFTVLYQGASPRPVMQVHVNALAAPTDTFTVDYTLDWNAAPIPTGAGNFPPTADEMKLFGFNRKVTINDDPRTLGNPPTAPRNSLPSMRIFGNAALSASDYLFTAGGDYPAGDRVYAYQEQFSGTNTGNPNTKLAWMFYPNAPDDDFNLGGGGLPGRFHNTDPFIPTVGATPTADVFVSDFEQIGAPAYSNGVVYVMGYCHLRSDQPVPSSGLPDGVVIMALRAKPNTYFTVTGSGPLTAPVTLQQPDPVNSTALSPKYITMQSTNFTVNQVDTNSYQITINDFRTGPSGDAFNTALPITVLSAGNPYTTVVNPQTGFGPLDNVLWWMTVPFQFSGGLNTGLPYPAIWSGSNPGGLSGLKPASGPSILGSTLYYGSTTGQVVSVDMSGISPSGGQVNVYKDDGTSRVAAKAAMTNGVGIAIQQPIFSPPVATTGIVAVGTPQGLSVLDNQLTLIADNHRLIEVDRSGNAAWTTDATQSIRFAQSEGNNGNQIAAAKISFARPNMAHRTSLNDFIVADTGNNRIVQLDKGGIATWELSKVNNDLRFLTDNDPVVLNQPTDVQTYTSSGTGALTFTSPISNAVYTYNAGPWVAYHYIIADSGNFRAMEVVDVYGANGNPVVMTGSDGTNPTMLRQVVFVTRSKSEQNKNLRYRTIQQFQNFENSAFRTYMVAAVDNAQQGLDLNPLAANIGTSSSAVTGPGGSLMIIKRYPPAGQGKDGDVAALINSIVYVNGTTIVRRQTISNPRWFKEFNVANPANLSVPLPHYALADANGVYVLTPGTGALAGEAVIEWALSNDDYYFMTGRHLNATSIQKLDQADYDPVTNKFYPHYLITNAYTGRDNIVEVFGASGNVVDGDVHGEVFEVRSDYFTTQASGGASGYRSAIARLYQFGTGAFSGYLIANPSSAITWMTPSETIPLPPASASNPLPGVIKRKIGSGTNGTATGLLEQPAFSDRPF